MTSKNDSNTNQNEVKTKTKFAVKFLFSEQVGREKPLKDALYRDLNLTQEKLFPVSFITRKQIRNGELKDDELKHLKKNTAELIDLMTSQQLEVVMDRIGKFMNRIKRFLKLKIITRCQNELRKNFYLGLIITA